MRWVAVLVALSLVLSGCSMYASEPQLDEHGCTEKEQWCASLEKCIDPWDSYCPGKNESSKLITATECRRKGGRAVDYGGGQRCDKDESVQGEIAGLLSLHVCCVAE